MHRFAELLDRLTFTPARNGKLQLLENYFRETSDPDRGFALAAITGNLELPGVKPATIRGLILERMDPELFAYSYDFVGDLAETVSLAWPDDERVVQERPSLEETVSLLQSATRADGPATLGRILDRLEPSGRYAALKLVTGGLRIGVSSRLAKQALARMGGLPIGEIEEIWHGLAPPYVDLFAWLCGQAGKPENLFAAPFRPVMLANPLHDGDIDKLEPNDFLAEWKWDGIRVQLSSSDGIKRLYSRSGDDISHTFPDIIDAANFEGTIDGELLVGKPPERVGTFSDLQQRLNRKKVSAKMLSDFPVFIRCYDLLIAGEEDCRGSALTERRKRLHDVVGTLPGDRFDISETIAIDGWQALDHARNNPPQPVIEGLMLKRLDSGYVAGRPKGPWFKWKRDPHVVDAVLMYAQRGHGKRSGFYSDYTFGVWSGDLESASLVAVGKAYFGFSDEELRQIDKFVRENTVERYGPVRAVRAGLDAGLVLEVAFEGINRSTRHKSGVAMRFPRISRLRWDKQPHEADHLNNLLALLPEEATR